MAKAKASAGSTQKISFGKKSVGKAKKNFGKYEEKPKKYRGQGK